MPQTSAHLDDLHAGTIDGALGTTERDGPGVSTRWTLQRRLSTFLAVFGPGVIVMVGDNDAGAFGTYTQAGQNYGTVLYVNQEMVLRLCAVSGWLVILRAYLAVAVVLVVYKVMLIALHRS